MSIAWENDYAFRSCDDDCLFVQLLLFVCFDDGKHSLITKIFIWFRTGFLSVLQLNDLRNHIITVKWGFIEVFDVVPELMTERFGDRVVPAASGMISVLLTTLRAVLGVTSSRFNPSNSRADILLIERKIPRHRINDSATSTRL